MQSKDLLMQAMQVSHALVVPLLDDLKDAPMQAPTANGGNHPVWVAGHLAFGEGNLFWHMMRGEPNPLAEWAEIFDGGSEPSDDASKYPPLEELIAKYCELREQSLALLGSLSEEDLDQPSANCPEEYAGFFGTWRQCYLSAALHGMMHRGQLADSRKSLGRTPVMA